MLAGVTMVGRFNGEHCERRSKWWLVERRGLNKTLQVPQP